MIWLGTMIFLALGLTWLGNELDGTNATNRYFKSLRFHEDPNECGHCGLDYCKEHERRINETLLALDPDDCEECAHVREIVGSVDMLCYPHAEQKIDKENS